MRAPQSPDQSTRRAATWYHANQLQLRVTLAEGYTGNLNLYALDWDTTTRRQNVTVSDGTTTRQSALTSSFNQGAWMTFPVNVAPGGTITITIDRTAGPNAVLSAITLGGPLQTEPPAPGVLLDSFDRADSPSLGVTDTGQTWSGLEGSFGVQGGAAGVGTAGYSLAVVDSGDGDGVVSARVAVPSSELWLVLRSSDGTNYWRFGRTSTGSVPAAADRRRLVGVPGPDDTGHGERGRRGHDGMPPERPADLLRGQRHTGGVRQQRVQPDREQGRVRDL